MLIIIIDKLTYNKYIYCISHSLPFSFGFVYLVDMFSHPAFHRYRSLFVLDFHVGEQSVLILYLSLFLSLSLSKCIR